MNKFEALQQFLATETGPVPIFGFIFNLLLAAALSHILSRIYIKRGTSLSNRRMFAKNFLLLTMTTTLIIAVVKSSLALSLGLVGALSIVRFRAAIKEPEELAYLFVAIAIGLGLGANQRLITIVAFAVICVVIMLRKSPHSFDDDQSFYLTVSTKEAGKISLEKITDILKKYCLGVNIKRFDETKDMLEATFVIELDNLKNLGAVKSELQKLNDAISITFLDNRPAV